MVNANNKKLALLEGITDSFLPDNQTHQNRFEIHSETSNRVYVISQAKATGEWQCGCLGWIMKKAGKERSCKHTKALMPILLQISSTTTTTAKPKKVKGA